MASILGTLLPSFAVDVVAVYDQDMVQVIRQARSIRANVRPSSRPMEHPLESGAIITDHRIILPTEIELSVILQKADYVSTYKSITQFFLNGTLLVVQTKVGVFKNQLIQSIPSEEDAEQYDAVTMVIKLKQVQFVNLAALPNTANPRDNGNVNAGLQNGQMPTTTQAAQATTAQQGAMP